MRSWLQPQREIGRRIQQPRQRRTAKAVALVQEAMEFEVKLRRQQEHLRKTHPLAVVRRSHPVDERFADPDQVRRFPARDPRVFQGGIEQQGGVRVGYTLRIFCSRCGVLRTILKRHRREESLRIRGCLRHQRTIASHNRGDSWYTGGTTERASSELASPVHAVSRPLSGRLLNPQVAPDLILDVM